MSPPLKVLHLFNYLQKVERDLEEVETLKNNVPVDRSYSTSLSLSLQEQGQELTALQEKILSQVIKDPPAFLVDELNEKLHLQKARPPQAARAAHQKAEGWPQEPSLIMPKALSSQSTPPATPPAGLTVKASSLHTEEVSAKRSVQGSDEIKEANARRKSKEAQPDTKFPFTFRSD